ncbi:type VI secretion system membrane subunit TssM [Luteimonas sp. SJ-92]|uniref:Type VI secretion system membrane subunit TssM n=1 Tax=Luteimonas salinisoli TaxID=2752307 RepID=A0A853JJ68_9GAMM|nr:type VI secretion system membrane subunit TssM [Luteimonas salinisoli]NZA28508.1 type VI secretion system membrane subunit TssM [Luteimonas salinisoli]
MFYRLRYYLTDYRVLAVIGIASAAALMYFGADGLRQIGVWALLLLVVALLVWAMVWGVRRVRARRAAKGLDQMVEGEAERAVANAQPATRADTEALRERMLEAVKAIKSSRIGVLKGKAALYELPWYVIIGNPAAGKSSAILNSGLKFPFEDNRSNVIQGIGGTRNCDWYFTTEGIVLDTAGRYSVSVEDRLEWLTFLDLLKKHRPRAPINGIIIAASIAELSGSKPEFAIELAKNLRQRVQEITERLEVFAPVYVVFTKADLIAGFTEFFRGLDPSERENVWGATLPFDPQAGGDALASFDRHFDELADGLKEMSLAQMAMQRGREVSPGLLALPLEFVGIKPALRTFVATLFEDNPYQFKPVFRGFYFTSALQEGNSVHYASERIGREFSLQGGARAAGSEPSGQTAHFLKDLFRKVVFADRQLVQQYSSPHQTRLRYAVFLGAVAALALVLGLWTWSYTTNRQLVANATKDLEQAVRVQNERVDLKSRIDALLLLQDRLEQVSRYREQRSVATRLGLYQGDRIEAKLLQEYFDGMRQVMLAPTGARIEAFLGEVVAQGDALAEPTRGEQAKEESLYQEASPTDTNDAYNALKTYLMLGNPERVERAHLGHQLTRFWRGWLDANRGQMSREDMARAAEKLMSFYVARADHPAWPRVDTRVSLISDARAALTQATRGEPAINRVFAQVKARAATRFPTITVNSLIGDERNKDAIAGSYAISGAFSRKAWEDYVKGAIDEAANTELSTTDWVLDTTEQSDLSLAGSPEHISRELATMYKQEYAQEWQKFLQGVSVAPFGSFDAAVTRMNSIGDPQNSPLRALLEAVNEQTVWDNPAAAAGGMDAAKGGFVAWFQRVILRRTPSSVSSQVDPETGRPATAPMGPIGKAFEGFARLVSKRDGAALIDSYFQTLGKLRSRLNAIRTEGEPGPGARRLMQDTLGNEGSELNAALALVDEQMLTGLDEGQRDALRPLLLRPLTETFAALVPPTEAEVNRVWAAQVYEPFRGRIGRQFPFDPGADVDAAPSDVAAIFGASGAIAAFNKETLGTLVLQRGNLLEARRWAGLGITLQPALVSGYGDWVSGQPGGAGAADTTIFEIQPQPAIGAVEFTLEIDGQVLRYRNTPPAWQTFQWPNPGAIPGVKLSAVTSDGRTVELVNAPGGNGLARMMELASAAHRDDSSTLTWEKEGVSVSVVMRITRRPGSGGGNSDWQRGLQLPATVAGATARSADAQDTEEGA